MVITGLTRNQFGSNPTWVRIPPAPPTEKPVNKRVCWLFSFLSASQNRPENRCSFHRFGKNRFCFLRLSFFIVCLPFALKATCSRKHDSVLHCLRRGQLGRIVQMSVDIRCGAEIRMTEPVLNLL